MPKAGDLVRVGTHQCQPSDLPQLKTDRDSWVDDENRKGIPADVKAKQDQMIDSISRVGVLLPALGYVEKNVIKLLDGRQRWYCTKQANAALEAEGKAHIKFPVLLIAKEEAVALLENQYIANNHRIEDTFSVQLATYRALSGEGRTNEQIANIAGKSAAWIGKILRVGQSPTLVAAVNAGQIDADSASKFTGKEYVDKAGTVNEDKIKSVLKTAIEETKAAGGTKVKRGAATTVAAAGSGKKASAKSLWGKDHLKKMMDAPVGTVPVEFQMFILVLLGKETPQSAQKKARGGLDWLSEVDFRSSKEKKAAKKETAAKNKQAKKAEDPLTDDEDDLDDFEE